MVLCIDQHQWSVFCYIQCCLCVRCWCNWWKFPRCSIWYPRKISSALFCFLIQLNFRSRHSNICSFVNNKSSYWRTFSEIV